MDLLLQLAFARLLQPYPLHITPAGLWYNFRQQIRHYPNPFPIWKIRFRLWFVQKLEPNRAIRCFGDLSPITLQLLSEELPYKCCLHWVITASWKLSVTKYSQQIPLSSDSPVRVCLCWNYVQLLQSMSKYISYWYLALLYRIHEPADLVAAINKTARNLTR